MRKFTINSIAIFGLAGAAALAWVLISGAVSQPVQAQSSHTVTADIVERWMTELSNWGRWGKQDQMGAVNLITPAKRKQAASLVRDGIPVSLARNTETVK